MKNKTQKADGDSETLKSHQKNLSKMSDLIATMPSLKVVEEHWSYYLGWKIQQGIFEPVPVSLEEALSTCPTKHLAEFFQFWLVLQRAYLAAMTIEDDFEITEQFDEEWRVARESPRSHFRSSLSADRNKVSE